MRFTKSFLNLFVLISIVKPSISQINKDCVSWGLRGVCVSSESCGFFNKATKAILNVETLKSVQDRVAACEKYQKNSVCCEKGDVKSNVLVTTTPSQKTSLAKVTFKTLTTQRLTTTTTLKLSKIIESTTRTTVTTTAKATTSTTTAPGTSTSPPTLAAATTSTTVTTTAKATTSTTTAPGTSTSPPTLAAATTSTTVTTTAKATTSTTTAPGTSTSPPTLAAATTSTTVTTTAKATTSTTTAPGTSTSPPTLAAEDHPKYKLFKDLKCGLIHSDRVAGGENADFYEFPWAARLGYLNDQRGIKYACGGSLISEFYVLTAAHCLVGLQSNLKLNHVRLGEYDADKDTDCDPEDPERCADPVQDVKIQSVVSHSDYERMTLSNDIGLVQLSEAAKIKRKNIKPICMPFEKEHQEFPQQLVVIGWGATESMEKPGVLQKAVLPLFDHTKCQQKFVEKSNYFKLNDRQFCAGGEGKIDTCKGDSGSPIMGAGLKNDKPKLFQYGIVSWGVSGCGVEVGYPGVYTDVSKYIIWILENLQ